MIFATLMQEKEYIHVVKAGLPFKTILFTYKHGNNIGNLNFIWKVTEDSLTSSQRVIEQLKPQLPVYHTRFMRKSMFQRFGRLIPNMKPAVMRYIYKELTGNYLNVECTYLPKQLHNYIHACSSYSI